MASFTTVPVHTLIYPLHADNDKGPKTKFLGLVIHSKKFDKNNFESSDIVGILTDLNPYFISYYGPLLSSVIDTNNCLPYSHS